MTDVKNALAICIWSLKDKTSDTYLTIGMGIRARRGKNLDKWYFSLTDGRRIGKDFFLYKDSGEKVTTFQKRTGKTGLGMAAALLTGRLTIWSM